MQPMRALQRLIVVAGLLCAGLSTTSLATIADDGRNFSTLDGITPANVGHLQHAWTYRTGDLATRTPDQLLNQSFQATPRLIAGNIVFCTSFNEMIAISPTTGRQRWRFDPKLDPKLPQLYQNKCRGPLASWTDVAAPETAPCRTRIFSSTLDHRLFAIDARTGSPCAVFGTGGVVRIIKRGEEQYPNDIRFISMPIVVGDRLILGSAMTDNFHVANPSGKVRAFDVRTGALAWTFDPLVRAAPAAHPGAAVPPPLVNGGTNVWTLIAADPANGLVFLPTTSPNVDHFGGERPGDNLYADSVVALDAETGRMRWARQLVHHDLWDYDLPAQPIVTDMRIAGKAVPVVIQNTKMGLVFVFNRLTGAPIFPIVERAVPQGGVAGEHLSPTQPFPVGMPSLGPLGMTEDDLWGVTFVDKYMCKRRFDALRHGPIYTPPSLEGTILRPSFFGGANWGGASYDARTGVMIAPIITVPSIVKLTDRRRRAPPPPGAHVTFQDGPITFPDTGSPYRATLELFASPLGAPCSKPPWYTLVAMDVPHRKILWRVPLGTTEEQAPFGMAFKWGTPSIGGLVSTAGGVTFIGATLDKRVRAFDSSTGGELWTAKLPTSVNSTPFTYRVGGQDYVVFIAGGHSLLKMPAGDYVIAFRVPRAHP